jgi:hypothetical protein|tara:strand:- start:232 stop:441 length:210 start_codon:yes stop_codon:yes gene_type:complete
MDEKLKKLIESLEEIEGSLDNAYYSLPEYDANSEGRSYLDSARNDVYVLKDELERIILDNNKVRSSEMV